MASCRVDYRLLYGVLRRVYPRRTEIAYRVRSSIFRKLRQKKKKKKERKEKILIENTKPGRSGYLANA